MQSYFFAGRPGDDDVFAGAGNIFEPGIVENQNVSVRRSAGRKIRHSVVAAAAEPILIA